MKKFDFNYCITHKCDGCKKKRECDENDSKNNSLRMARKRRKKRKNKKVHR